MRIVKNKKKAKGFTLIELIIVIAIIGILALIIIPQVIGYTNKARNGTAVSDAKTLISAIDTYNAEQGALASGGNPIDLSTDTNTLNTLAAMTTGAAVDPTVKDALSSIKSSDNILYEQSVLNLSSIADGKILVH